MSASEIDPDRDAEASCNVSLSAEQPLSCILDFSLLAFPLGCEPPDGDVMLGMSRPPLL